MSEQSKTNEESKALESIGQYKYGFHDPDQYVFKSQRGLSRDVVENISHMKGEPQWMLDFRLKALDHFLKRPMPTWGPELAGLDLDNIFYYVKPTEGSTGNWDEVPQTIKNTFDKLGIPEAERKFLAGVGSQYDSEMVYHSMLEHLEKQGVIFLSIEDGLRKHPDLFREYFSTVIPIEDNKFSALNSAVWSGGSFVYVPKGVKVDLPLQAYFRLNTANVGQFERSLIIVDEGAQVHYVEGCFLEGAMIRTSQGEKRIEQIKVGDEVLTHLGRYRKVYHTNRRPYHGNIYHIRHSGEQPRTLHVTEEHPLLVVPSGVHDLHEGRRNPVWKNAADLKEGDSLAAPSDLAGKEFAISGTVNSSVAAYPEEVSSAAVRNGTWGMDDDIIHRQERFLYLPICEIQFEEMETEVYNLSVEEDETYVAEGVVSHNCTAPQYTSNSLHSGVIEIIVKKGARSRYSTIQNWSHNVYNLVTQRAKVYGDATHEWVDANLGCLAEGSTITTPDGIKPIEALQLGEKVLSYDETTGRLGFHAVTAKRFSGYQPVHTVSVGERQLRVTANHPFLSYLYDPGRTKNSQKARLGYVRADHLTEVILPRTSLEFGKPYPLTLPKPETTFERYAHSGAARVMTRHHPVRLMTNGATDEDLMWGFGYWLGEVDPDGGPAQPDGVARSARMGFSTPRQDQAHARFTSVMESLIDPAPAGPADGDTLSWNSDELAGFFAANGFDGKSSIQRAPKWVWSLPESQRLAFLAGTMDAVGWMRGRYFSLRSVNRPMLEDCASLLVTLGITSHLHPEISQPRKPLNQGNEGTPHESYHLEFLSDPRLLPYLSQDLRDKARGAQGPQDPKFLKVGGSTLALSEEVEIVHVQVSGASRDTVPTWDIEVAGTGNFVSQGFIVHNSKLTMKYPSCYLMEPGAHGEMLSMAFAGPGQHQDTGSKMIHFAPNTTSKIVSKSISKGGGRSSYRGLLRVVKGSKGVRSNASCDALILDPQSRSDTYPYIEIDEDEVTIGHEASVSKVGEEQLFYLMSRGLSQEEATSMVVSGFIEPLVKELPMEYAVEMNRLIQLQMSGSVG